MNQFNISQNTKNNNSNTNSNINPNNNIESSRSNIAFYNKSIQQEKYDSIKIFCTKKNDPDNYPLISYENFLLIDSLSDKNSSSNEPYTNFLLNKNASIELYSKFCTLLMNRYIISKQNSSINKYPKVVYQIIFDVNNVYNYLSPDIVADAKESNMFMLLIYYQNMWNVAVFNKNNNTSVYFMFNKNTNKKIILELMNTINKEVYPEQKFEINISDYSGFSTGNKTVLPFIILDFYSRYKNLQIKVLIKSSSFPLTFKILLIMILQSGVERIYRPDDRNILDSKGSSHGTTILFPCIALRLHRSRCSRNSVRQS